MLDNSLTLTAAKGGALKTAISSAVAGLAAQDGWRVLLVDTDRQGNVACELGYESLSDQGKGLAEAIMNGAPLNILRDVRPGLDVIAGGSYTDLLTTWIGSQATRGNFSTYRCLENVLEPVAGDYDLIVFDSPPGQLAIHAVLLTAAHYIIIPVQFDAASHAGLEGMLSQVLDVRDATNPQLEVLGVVLAPVDSRATSRARTVRDRVKELVGEQIPVFDATVRLAQSTASLGRDRGLLPFELAAAADRQPAWWRARQGGTTDALIPATAAGLADDYRKLTVEILNEFVARRSRA